MNTLNRHITYRGFTPQVIDVNYSIQKPDVIYRGFKVISSLFDKKTYLTKSLTVYRGIRYTGIRYIGTRHSGTRYAGIRTGEKDQNQSVGLTHNLAFN